MHIGNCDEIFIILIVFNIFGIVTVFGDSTVIDGLAVFGNLTISYGLAVFSGTLMSDCWNSEMWFLSR